MRNEFYADSRDVSKWSVIAGLVKEFGFSTVVQATMLRQDRKEGHGGTRHRPSICDPAIERYFEEERRIIEANPRERRIGRVVDLPKAAGLACTIVVDERPFEGQNLDYRRPYFEEVVRTTGAAIQPVLAFLDPDNGLSFLGDPQPTQVAPSEVAMVFESVRGSGGLLIYQHAVRKTAWAEEARDLARLALPKEVEAMVFKDRDVAFLFFRGSR